MHRDPGSLHLASPLVARDCLQCGDERLPHDGEVLGKEVKAWVLGCHRGEHGGEGVAVAQQSHRLPDSLHEQLPVRLERGALPECLVILEGEELDSARRDLEDLDEGLHPQVLEIVGSRHLV